MLPRYLGSLSIIRQPTETQVPKISLNIPHKSSPVGCECMTFILTTASNETSRLCLIFLVSFNRARRHRHDSFEGEIKWQINTAGEPSAYADYWVRLTQAAFWRAERRLATSSPTIRTQTSIFGLGKTPYAFWGMQIWPF
ncbi:hypothetical protein Salat_0638400 [Sesamum alatum]|uniref:Uncharacterized protein n=1 Tax=Sesamum alatum TaxID=300844 RepID=A0AAE1YR08_9LAMI|nr:hypothetical protein Salat_0638400 [Sesamum alatum]